MNIFGPSDQVNQFSFLLSKTSKMEGIPLKRFKRDLDDTETDIKKSIVYQKSTSQALSSTEAGRKRILEAAEIRQDERLEEKDLQEFTYHVSNECYKRYTHKKSLETLKNKALLNETEELQINETSCNVTLQNDQRSTRSQVSPRALPKSYNVDIYCKSCVICGHLRHKGDYEKFRISEEFLKAAVFFQNEVYVRICDLFVLFWGQIYFVTKMFQKLPSKV